MYVLIVECKSPKIKTDKWKVYTRYVCVDKTELDKSLKNTEWISNTYCAYRMTYYEVNLASAVVVESKIVLEEVK